MVNGPTGLGVSVSPIATAHVRSTNSSPALGLGGNMYMRISGMLMMIPCGRARGRIQRVGTTTSRPGGGIHSSTSRLASFTSWKPSPALRATSSNVSLATMR
jgi:hypothetical protein